MVTIECPWCAAEFGIDPEELRGELSCAECATAWKVDPGSPARASRPDAVPLAA